MKPSKIFDVLDLARKIKKNGKNFTPCFVSPPGLGKSEMVKQWATSNNLFFFDLRSAYLERPDMLGYPDKVVKEDGKSATVHAPPEFLFRAGEWVLFLDEINRGDTSTLNTFMQILTDGKVHDHPLSKETIIVSAINPENADYDVTTMDPALRDRLEFFEVDYDKEDFVKYMKATGWDSSVIGFVETDTFKFIKPENVGKTDGNKYISPRTLSKLNAALQAGIPTEDLEMTVFCAVLGRNVGTSFYHFKNNEQPVTFEELNSPKTFKVAIEKLRILSDPKNYKMGSVSVTKKNVIENETKLSDDLLASILLALPADQGPNLVQEIAYQRQDKDIKLLDIMKEKYPSIKKYWKDVLVKKEDTK